jgi:hypothetical protein
MTKFVYKGRTATDVALRLLDGAIDDETYIAVLGNIGNGIREAGKRTDSANELGFERFAEPLIDLETEFIESQLGTAYLSCQVKITEIAEAALHVREMALNDGHTFRAFGNKDHSLRALGPAFDGAYSKAEILWALANDFKHRDQWPPGSWQSPPSSLVQRTIDAIKAAGLQESSSGNLRTGAEALGNRTYEEVALFGQIIGDWASCMRVLIRNDLGK